MKRYAAAFPSLMVPWITALRRKHDPLAELVAPHLTLLFPTARPTLDELTVEVTRATRCATFRVVLRSALAMPENGRSYVFLVPDEGFADLTRLHERIYHGPLASELRLDVPFIPHLTVAAGLEHEEARTIARDLNRTDFAIALELDTIEIVEIHGEERRRVRRIPLAL